MKKAGVDHKINFIKSDALEALDQLLNGVRKDCSCYEIVELTVRTNDLGK